MLSESVNDGLTLAFQPPRDRPLLSFAQLVAVGGGAPTLQHVVHAEGSASALLAHRLGCEVPVLCIVPDAEAARRMRADLLALSRDGLLEPEPTQAAAARAGEPEPLLIVPADHSPFADAHPDRRATLERTRALFHLAKGLPWRYVVTTAQAWVRKVLPAELLAQAGYLLKVDGLLDTSDVAERLSGSGYLRAPIVEDPGSFALRGGILDVWPAGASAPVRAELIGDCVVSLRTFNAETQRVAEAIEQIWLPPGREAIVTLETRERARELVRGLADSVNLPSSKTRALVEEVSSGRAYFGAETYLPAFAELVPLSALLPAHAAVVIEEPASVVSSLRAAREQAARDAAATQDRPHFAFDEYYVADAQLAADLRRRRVFALQASTTASSAEAETLDQLQAFPPNAPSLVTRGQSDLTRAVKALRGERGHAAILDPLVQRLTAWAEQGLSVTITARVATQAERIATLLRHRGVAVHVQTADSGDAMPGAASTDVARLAHEPGVVRLLTSTLTRGVIAPLEGYVLLTEEEIFGERTHRRRSKQRSARGALDDLRALTTGDYVVHVDHGIGRYRGLERLEIGGCAVELLVVEYEGGTLFLPIYRLNQIQKYASEGGAPKLDRLGGLSFAKTKAKVQRKVRQMADELLRLYAERAALTREPLSLPGDEYAEFEATFPFEETPDQAAAIQEVLRDLERPCVMDRLVCGDVGFGKTEVSVRAAFLTAMAGRQVAFLCPTTVLAQQHFATFSQRLSGYALNVRVLSRFQTRQQVQDTLVGLKAGSVDVVIGTHRLLSKDVHFKNLGLLVIDEEQRFGVGHKERIKQMRTNVDVLTLSATPIPRTLQMAVSGMRDMSLITTAPVDRRSIRTIITRYDDNLLRQALERELGRGGQVFYVYNRIEGIEERAARLQALVPQARLCIAHGRMSEAALERTMLEFVDGQYDVLVATAIIESGLDIPRANTMIIDRADTLGLAQLYQLRGRVGRSRERAYCYLVVPAEDQLSDEGRMRVEALERHTDLGSGFQIATLDMQLRGAGELLGAEQTGFAASVGLDLFCEMLEQATRELQGQPVVSDVDPDLSLDVEALLPEEYIEDVGVRLSVYKRLASAENEDEVRDLTQELNERFGQPPPEARRFIELMRIKTELRRLRVLGCEASARSVTLHLRADTLLDPAKVANLVNQHKRLYQLAPDGRLTRRAPPDDLPSDGLVHVEMLLDELSKCVSS